jgi:CRP-like cAMP-binding protein
MPDFLGREYADGEVVVREGETGDCMFVVQGGSVEVVKGEGADATRMGVLERGAVFGEMAIFERERRSATVRSLGGARILTVDRRTFLRRVHEDPTLALNILESMSRRIRGLNSKVNELERRLREEGGSR